MLYQLLGDLDAAAVGRLRAIAPGQVEPADLPRWVAANWPAYSVSNWHNDVKGWLRSVVHQMNNDNSLEPATSMGSRDRVLQDARAVYGGLLRWSVESYEPAQLHSLQCLLTSHAEALCRLYKAAERFGGTCLRFFAQVPCDDVNYMQAAEQVCKSGYPYALDWVRQHCGPPTATCDAALSALSAGNVTLARELAAQCGQLWSDIVLKAATEARAMVNDPGNWCFQPGLDLTAAAYDQLLALVIEKREDFECFSSTGGDPLVEIHALGAVYGVKPGSETILSLIEHPQREPVQLELADKIVSQAEPEAIRDAIMRSRSEGLLALAPALLARLPAGSLETSLAEVDLPGFVEEIADEGSPALLEWWAARLPRRLTPAENDEVQSLVRYRTPKTFLWLARQLPPAETPYVKTVAAACAHGQQEFLQVATALHDASSHLPESAVKHRCDEAWEKACEYKHWHLLTYLDDHYQQPANLLDLLAKTASASVLASCLGSKAAGRGHLVDAGSLSPEDWHRAFSLACAADIHRQYYKSGRLGSDDGWGDDSAAAYLYRTAKACGVPQPAPDVLQAIAANRECSAVQAAQVLALAW